MKTRLNKHIDQAYNIYLDLSLYLVFLVIILWAVVDNVRSRIKKSKNKNEEL